MKTSTQKTTTAPLPADFQKAAHRVRPIGKTATITPKKRDNIFSKSRDTREDRGSRQMKMSHNPQTLPHGR